MSNTLVAGLPAQDLVRQPGGVMQWVDYVSVFDPAIQNTRRYVACDTRIEDIELHAGDTVLVLLASTSHYREKSPAQIPPIGFGHGAHVSPGHVPACIMACAALEIFLQRQPLDNVRMHWTYRASVYARIPQFHAIGDINP